MMFLFFISFLVSTTVCASSIYQQELNNALASPATMLHQVSRIDNVVALKVLRKALWEDFLMATQNRRSVFSDRVGYFLCEGQIDAFKNRSYVLTPSEAPALYALAAQYASRLAISLPLFVLVDDTKLCDANSASWDAKSGFIVLGRGLFEEYTEEQFKAVLAYQMGHLAQRTHAYVLKFFTPAMLVIFAATLYGLAKIDPVKHNSIVAAAQALGMISASGILSCLLWCFLMRKGQSHADSMVAKIDPKLGLALISALERDKDEDDGGDMALTQKMVTALVHIDQLDRENILAIVEKINTVSDVRVAVQSAVDSGIFGTQHPLETRKAFFEKMLLFGV